MRKKTKPIDSDEKDEGIEVTSYKNCYCLVMSEKEGQSKEMLELINNAIRNLTITVDFKQKVQWMVYRMFKQLEPVSVTLICPRCGRKYSFTFPSTFGFVSEADSKVQ